MPLVTAAPSLYRDTPAGRICRGCDRPTPGPHALNCPVVVLRLAVQEVTMQLGLYVATVRELLDDADRLLRDDPPREETEDSDGPD